MELIGTDVFSLEAFDDPVRAYRGNVQPVAESSYRLMVGAVYASAVAVQVFERTVQFDGVIRVRTVYLRVPANVLNKAPAEVNVYELHSSADRHYRSVAFQEFSKQKEFFSVPFDIYVASAKRDFAVKTRSNVASSAKTERVGLIVAGKRNVEPDGIKG